MKHKLLLLLLCLPMMVGTLFAQSFVNLTPRPKSLTAKTGTLVLPAQFSINTSGLDEAMKSEVDRFVKDFTTTTGLEVSVADDGTDGLVKIGLLPATSTLGEGGYTLDIATDGVTIEAREALGLFYALQSFKKILPANVMAGVKDEKITEYALPLATITDEPRFAYRGFMLDVSRHFFTVEEVKRMIDVMSYYKLNRFHWHLSDDQGWRIEIKKYPKLTTIGATAPNRRFTDMYSCTQYWINKPYGPYFYTQDQIREVVAYAKERHIEIVPEIDMPGHFTAAMAAYPEFSCTPDGSHTVCSDGGIYGDILNVANPQAVQFAKDILAELMDLFPYKLMHIGGDECPTGAWERNALCQQEVKDKGYSSYRELQSHFIKEMGDFVKERGYELAVWNEAITAGSADVETVKGTDAIVYCWTGAEAAAKKAQQLGMRNIYTPWGPYYINRRQGNSELDPPGAGDGTDNVQKTYNTTVPSETDYGVQGTFWCEHVSDREYMEWLALPRLIAVAEAGWTPAARKDFSDFQKRMSADTLLLNYGGYKYCKYFMLDEDSEEPTMVMPKVSTESEKHYYRLISGGTDSNRKDRCIELLAEGSELLETYAGNGALVGRLWTNVQAAEGAANYDYQQWYLEESTDAPGKYALVCKALPNGSLNPTPTGTGVGGRWIYDSETKHYNIQIGTAAYGKVGSNYYYTLTTDKIKNLYLNSSMPGQGLAVNVYSQPTDGGGGQWQFAPMDAAEPEEKPIAFPALEKDKTYCFRNDVDGYEQTALVDDGGNSTALHHATNPFAANAWRVTATTDNGDGTQSVKLVNVETGRAIAATGDYVSRKGYPVTMATAAKDVRLSLNEQTSAMRLQMDSRSFFPLPDGTVNAGSTIQGASYDAPRLQGAEWQIEEVRVVTFNCVDDKGHALGVAKRSVPTTVGEVGKELCPVFKNHGIETLTETSANVYSVVYKRNAYAVTLQGVDPYGVIVSETEVAVPVDAADYTVKVPEVKYYTFESSEVADGTTAKLESDTAFVFRYTTDALTGVSRLAENVTDKAAIVAGQRYVIMDASPVEDGARKGYRRIEKNSKKINRFTNPEAIDPSGVWTIERPTASLFKMKNDYYGLYVPALQKSTPAVAQTSGGQFTLTLNSDKESWCVKGINGMMWDGLASGDLVGWDGGTGHPIQFYRFYGRPYYTATIRCVDESGKELQSESVLLPAGSDYPLVFPTIKGMEVKSVTGNEAYGGTLETYLEVTVTYAAEQQGIDNATIDSGDSKRSGIYDLSGRRLRRIARPGLYIVNGAKVLVK